MGKRVQREVEGGHVVQPSRIDRGKFRRTSAIGQHGSNAVGGCNHDDASGSPTSFATHLNSVSRQLVGQRITERVHADATDES